MDLIQSHQLNKIQWTPTMQRAFKRVKLALCQSPVLYTPQTLIDSLFYRLTHPEL